MAKSLTPIFFTTCGVVVAGVVGYAVIDPIDKPAKAPIIIAEKSSESVEEVKEEIAVEEQEVAKLNIIEVVEPKKADPIKPKFDLVRVEKDGSTVVAGQGPGNHVVELMDGDNKLAETTINSTGEFVFILDTPLEVGSHELFLRVVPKVGDKVLSSSFAFVDVPKPSTIGEVTVLLAEAGKPSQVLQKPEQVPNPVEIAKVEEPEITAVIPEVENTDKVASAVAQSSVTLAKPEVNSEADNQVASVSASPIVESKLAPVLIEAADVEAGKIFIAGTGEPRTTINIYLENKLIGSTRVSDNGAFLFEANKDIKAGRHNIRADMIKGSGVDVLARAEVTLVHEPKIAKVEKPVEPEPMVKAVPEQIEAAEVEPELSVEPQVNLVENAKPEEEVLVQAETKPELLEAYKKEIKSGSAVIIRRGDNLWTVARRNYGAGIRYTTIFDANRDQVRDPDRIYPGQVLKVPDEAQSVE